MDKKQAKRLAECASTILAHTLIRIDPQYPKVGPEQQQALREARVALAAEAPKGAEPDPFEAELAAKAAKQGARR